VAFTDQIEVGLAGLEKDFDLPYADILEMPTYGSLECGV